MAQSKLASPPLPTIYLPDILANWPWKYRLHPCAEEVMAKSADWQRSLHAFSPAAQRVFDKCRFGLLASMVYWDATKDQLRAGCDLMNLYFIIDEHTDVLTDAAETRRMVYVVMDALRSPDAPRLPGEWIGGEAARQFWSRARRCLCPLAQACFLTHFERYLNAVVTETSDRTVAAAATTAATASHTVESYLKLRSETIGLLPSLAINLAGLDALVVADLDDDPDVAALAGLACQMIGVANDLVSYPKERSEEQAGHNVVTIVLNTRRHVQEVGPSSPAVGSLEDEQAAVHWVAQYHAELEQAFLARYAAIRTKCLAVGSPSASASPVRRQQLLAYCDSIGQWIRSNDDWSFASGRYFGAKGPEVQRTRLAVLPPIKKKVTVLSVTPEEEKAAAEVAEASEDKGGVCMRKEGGVCQAGGGEGGGVEAGRGQQGGDSFGEGLLLPPRGPSRPVSTGAYFVLAVMFVVLVRWCL